MDTTVVLVMALAILFIILMADNEHDSTPPDTDLNWDNDSGQFNPVDAYDRETKEMGPPDLVDKSPGGLAIWREDTLKEQGIPLVEIILRDESVAHQSPAPHRDYLYATYKLNAPRDRISDILALSDSVTYDPLKQEVTARCHFMGANYATLYLATLIADSTIGKDVAKDMYGPAIMQTIPGHATYDPVAQNSYKVHLQRRLARQVGSSSKQTHSINLMI